MSAVKLNRGGRLSVLMTLAATLALLAAPSASAAIFGENFGLAEVNDGPGPAPDSAVFPNANPDPAPDHAFWGGTCSLGSPVDEVGVAPPAPRDCLDLGISNTAPLTASPWATVPSWRLAPFTGAGVHPDASAAFHFRRSLTEKSAGTSSPVPEGNAKDIKVEIPPGFLGDPMAVPQCPAELVRTYPLRCPPETQVGTAVLVLNAGFFEKEIRPIYLVEPRRGNPAELMVSDAASLTNVPVIGEIRSEEDFGLTTKAINLPSAGPVHANQVTLWAVPWDSIHDRWRGRQGYTGLGSISAASPLPTSFPPAEQVPYNPAWGPIKPFISTPTRCSAPPSVPNPETRVTFDSWATPGQYQSIRTENPPVENCEVVPFPVDVTLDPVDQSGAQASAADSPLGLDVELSLPQNNDPPVAIATNPDHSTGAPSHWASEAGLATAHLKDSTVVLPPGVSLNPSAANGLAICSPEQIGLVATDAPMPAPIRFNDDDPADGKGQDCPQAAKIATAKVESPLLREADWPTGDIYLASQKDNPFDVNFALYLVVSSPDRGLIVKIAGKAIPDPVTGQITATFHNTPQLPFDAVKLRFKAGPRAPLASPVTCGTHTIEADFTSWARPANPVHVSDPFETSSSPAGGCPTRKAERPFNLDLNAGSISLLAGARSPFQIQLTRPDGNQELERLQISPPPGFVASLRGIPYCSEQAIAAAPSRSGREEQSNPSCPSASEVGSTSVGAGAGSNPYYASGKLYLAGPYKGETLSVVSITPAVAGPFDLGTVVVRSALKIDRHTARITAVTDSLPQIFEGVPLRIKDVRIHLDRPNWAINPTNCSEMSVDVSAFGSDGAETKDSNRYQLNGCARLAFKPKLTLRLKGGTKRGDHPSLLATLKARPGDANIARAAVTLPRSAFLDQAHIRTICTRVQFAANQCPQGSIYGYSKATTPLLDDPIQGNVFLRSSDNKLPDLVGTLRGIASIDVVGRIDSVNGGIRNTFDVVPDAPVDTFTLTMQGGRKGLVINSKNLCAGTNRATVRLTGQNGRKYNARPPVIADGCKKAKKKRAKRKAAR